MSEAESKQVNVTFSGKLNRLIGSRSRAEIAKASGVPAQTITNYLTRGTQPSASAATALCKALGVSLDWLCDDAQDGPPFAPGTVPIEAVMADVGAAARPLLHAFVDRLQGDAVFLAIDADFEQFMAIVEGYAGGRLLDAAAGHWQRSAADRWQRMKYAILQLDAAFQSAGMFNADSLAKWIACKVKGADAGRLDELDYHGLLQVMLGLKSFATQRGVKVASDAESVA